MTRENVRRTNQQLRLLTG